MNTLRLMMFFIALFSLVSCRTDLDFEPYTQPLRFSADTVYLDPVFTETQSSSHLVKIYNTSNKNIKIPQLTLGKGEQSYFNLLIEGVSAKKFTNIELLAKDSLYVFVHTLGKADTQAKDFIYVDQIRLLGNSQPQSIELVTLIKDAYFLHPGKGGKQVLHTVQLDDKTTVDGFYFGDLEVHAANSLTMNDTKPYVIYGYAIIPENKILTLQRGTQIYFHENSGIIGLPGSAIDAEGTLDQPILLRGNRLEPAYAYTAGQWSGIRMQNPSTSILNHVTIEQAKIGLYLENATDFTIRNTKLFNHLYSALYASNSKVVGQNIIAAHTQNATVVLRNGGDYTFQHCTFSNTGLRPDQTALLVANATATPFEHLTIQNSILHTSIAQSFLFETKDNANIHFQSTAFKDTSKRNKTIEIYNYANESMYKNTILLDTPTLATIDFKNPKKNEFHYSSQMTQLIGKGDAEIARTIARDIDGKDRSKSADLGAYQHIETTKE
ncbi:right-handed parallel beta-helix repeat-containing protein [Myroides fluvii]|uniref:right-handed parallel beta-helix repeat-containing protein n=1 Tax=Myroides fluvii TaxID=2572594 RepID=UPI00131EA85E|nr:right-handed parallel beta-helix repeat-containing protein [Myroides fluvii]